MKCLPYILFENYICILVSEMARPGNQHCANCIGTLSFTMSQTLTSVPADRGFSKEMADQWFWGQAVVASGAEPLVERGGEASRKLGSGTELQKLNTGMTI